MLEVLAVTSSTISLAASAITIWDKFIRPFPTRRRRPFSVAMPLLRQDDLERLLGQDADRVLVHLDRSGYVPVDIVRPRKRSRAQVVPGTPLPKALSPLHRQLGDGWIPTRPLIIPSSVARDLSKNPTKFVDNVRPVEGPSSFEITDPRNRSQVMFWHKGRPHIGTKPQSKLSDLFEYDELIAPEAPLTLYPAESVDRELVAFEGTVLALFGSRRYRIQLTTRVLRLIELPRKRTSEILREEILCLRLDTHHSRLEVGLHEHEFLIEANLVYLRQIHEMLLGM